MMSGMLLETCWAFSKLWNNKFYYKLHLVRISTESYYDAWIHENQIHTTVQDCLTWQQHETDPQFTQRLCSNSL